MNKTISITVQPDEETNERLIKSKAAELLSRDGKTVRAGDITALVFRKKSIDARRGAIKICLQYTVYVGENPPAGATGDQAGAGKAFAPSWQKADPARRVAIVGSGPAGLFAALRLLEDGVTPIIVERGSPTSERKKAIARISREQKIDGESNYCFGEGGAGTFSDGKLYTRSNKRGDIGKILAIFHHHGADAEILTDAHPHIGTDRLPDIINRMRETIESFGGELRFNTRCTGFMTASGKVTGIHTTAGDIAADAVILATGHSARDVYAMLEDAARALSDRTTPVLEAKTFAMGVRVEHPRELIDRIQYHGKERGGVLPAATYRLSAQIEERGVYSFCMCPGGLIVPSATNDDEIVVNGMSPSSRDARWSNAAIVVEIRPEDIPEEFWTSPDQGDNSPAPQAPHQKSGDPLAGLRFQQWLERETKKHGDGQRAPAQRLVDFVDGKESRTLPPCSYSPGVVPSRIDQWLPVNIGERLRQAFAEYNKFMHGFISPEAIVVASETRTSSPVRILRNAETLESAALPGLYPAGEGSGYAGGIVSSAMDGEKCAEAFLRLRRE
jgi:uncharacterized FAD-dependent dehydrogenase